METSGMSFRAGISLAACFCAVVLFCSCATNPVTKKNEFVLMSEKQEIEVGRKMDPVIRKEYGVCSQSRLQEYVNTVGQRLARVSDRPDIFFHFTVLDSPVVNAFALPGGYVYITRGLMAHINSEAELAGVLAHEIGHITARHAVRQYTKAASYQLGVGVASIFVPDLARHYGQFVDLVFVAISRGYSRAYENEADSLAVRYAVKAGYTPRAVALLLKTLELISRDKNGKKSYTSLFATHPATEKRISAVEEALQSLAAVEVAALRVNRDEYLTEIDGLQYGEDVRAGVFLGATFRHPGFRIETVFPPGWELENRPDSVVACKGEAPAPTLELRLDYLTRRVSIEQAAALQARKLDLTLLHGTTEKINGLDAYIGTYAGSHTDLGSVTVRAGFFRLHEKIFYIAGFAPAQQFAAVMADFDRTIRSFRELTRREADAIVPTLIRLYTVKKGDTFDAIIKKSGRRPDERKTIALLNAWDPEKPPQPAPGTVIKVLAAQ